MTLYSTLVTVVGCWSSVAYTNRNLKAKIMTISKSNLENIWSMWCIDRPKIEKNGHIISFHVPRDMRICSIALAFFPYFFLFFFFCLLSMKSAMKMINDFVWKLNRPKFVFPLHRDHFVCFCHSNTNSQFFNFFPTDNLVVCLSFNVLHLFVSFSHSFSVLQSICMLYVYFV